MVRPFAATESGRNGQIMAQEIEAAPSPPALAPAEGPRHGPAAFLAQIQALGPGRILALGLVAAGLLALLAFIAFRVAEPRYTLLFGGLQPADAAALVDRLEALGTPYRLSERGDAVLVPAEEVTRLRMTLAQDGMPAGDVVGYELFDGANGFTTTDFLANVNLRRALEGELARTIASLREVRAARVHLVQPQRRLFQREVETPSASVLLTLNGAAELDRRQVEGVRYLVASAVPGLAAERVTVMDDRGNLLARGEDGSGPFLLDRTEEYRRAYEEQLRAKLVSLLERSIGPGRVDAQVTAEIDFDELSVTEELYDPQGQVVRSTRTTEEVSNRNEAGADNAVTVGNNLPAAPAAGGGPTSQEQVERTEETVNYEISRKQRLQRKRGGTVRRLFVAIQVDGSYVDDGSGNLVFEPRDREELAQLEALARSAVGIDEERGDRIEIVSRPFVQPEIAPVEEPDLLSTLLERYGRYLETLLWLLFGTLVLLFGVRPLIGRLLSGSTGGQVRPEQTAVVVGADGKPLLVHGASGTLVTVDERGRPVVVQAELPTADGTAPGRASTPGEPPSSGAEPGTDGGADDGGHELVNLDKVAGKVKASLVNEVADILERYPEEAVRVIRGWLHS